ncbi:acyl-CoA dehydrogenase family protein [Georgenia sp. SYP-B2076]|uniref:acyl-CoA dehydrogenase family protein n=1 Tax=Georgenia sp. SYP-B2076 TaxID=2495881 RepID=UPI000F8CE50D|nr:acyl-CoA dehydrogenase family protein [Georgenia sp. SYP-B2076]
MAITSADIDQTTTADEDAILEGLMSFIDKTVLPIQAEVQAYFNDIRLYFDNDGKEAIAVSEARRRVRRASAQAGYYNIFTPTELGGEGMSMRFFVRVTEALYEKYGPSEPQELLAYDALANVFTGAGPIWNHASDELKAIALPKVLAGEWQGSFGMSEPDAGSDLWSMRTTAVRDGDHWVINGGKQWTSWVAHADYLFVFAITDPEKFAARKGGISCFFVPTDTPGYKLESTIRLFQDAGGNEGITSYTDVRVPDAYRIGDEGDGLAMGFLTLTTTRLWVVARGIGEGRWAFNKCRDYSQVRKTFGKTISQHQSVQNLLADMATELYAAHSMTMNCAARADAGDDVRLETHIVKYFGTNACTRVFDNAIQLHGGMGVTAETKMVDGWRYSRICRITEGTDQIMQRSIAAHTLREGLPSWS